jgi:rhodanese-related sulfurtransferase
MRSSTAASLLERAGYDDVIDLAGGYAAWSAQESATPVAR